MAEKWLKLTKKKLLVAEWGGRRFKCRFITSDPFHIDIFESILIIKY